MNEAQEKLIKKEIKDFFRNPFNTALLLSAVIMSIIPIFLGFGLPVISILWIILFCRIRYLKENYPRKFMLLIFLAIAMGLMEIWSLMVVGVIIVIIMLFIPERIWQKIKK